jgi:hypothetical protein
VAHEDHDSRDGAGPRHDGHGDRERGDVAVVVFGLPVVEKRALGAEHHLDRHEHEEDAAADPHRRQRDTEHAQEVVAPHAEHGEKGGHAMHEGHPGEAGAVLDTPTGSWFR